MLRKLIFLPTLVLAASIAGAAVPPPVARWIPQDAVIVVEVSQPKAVLELLLAPRVASAVAALPAYEKLAAQPDFKQLLAGVDYLEKALKTDWRTGLRKLVGGGITVSVHPKNAALFIVECEDPKMLAQLHEIFLGIARVEAAKQGKPDRVASSQYRDATCWTFDGKEAHAVVGSRLLLASRPGLLKAALDLAADPHSPGLGSLAGYQAVRKAAGSETAAAFVNLKVLKQHPPFAKAMTQNTNPLAALLLAGVTDSVRDSNWLAAGLRVEGQRLVLRATVDGKPADPASIKGYASAKEASDGALPNLAVPRRIAAMSFYRDLHGFYAAKDQLFPERTSGLIFFENMMGIFFTGRDLTEEVLGEIRPEVRVVVAEQQYDPAVGTPKIRVPAFAAVFRLRNPDKFAEVVEEAWQKALGLINFTRGQQALPGLIIDRTIYGGTKYTTAYFSAKQEKDRQNLELRFNFRPALARQGEFMILSSTEGLAKDLIDAVKKETETALKPLAGTHSAIDVDGTALASILEANRDALVRQNMVNDGHTRPQAETQIDLLIAIAKHLGQTKLDVGNRKGRMETELELKLNLP
jgi:hypothetical protein